MKTERDIFGGELRETMEKQSRHEEEKFDYRIIHPYSEPINPEDDFVDIEVDFMGKTYRGSVTTTRFIDERLGYYRKTGENAQGSYFCVKGMIVLKRIDEETIKKTLEDLVERKAIKDFLEY